MADSIEYQINVKFYRFLAQIFQIYRIINNFVIKL
jgi:hypothetical protein